MFHNHARSLFRQAVDFQSSHEAFIAVFKTRMILELRGIRLFHYD